MHDEMRAYQEFLEKYAPYAYAQLFLCTRDFYRAQEELEEALVAGYRQWCRRHTHSPRLRHIQLMKRIVDVYKRRREERPIETPPPSSFSRAPKLRTMQQAGEILLSFSPTEQAALVLVCVEELPDATSCHWLEVDLPFLEDLRGRLLQKLEEWKPDTPTEEPPLTIFERAMQQYRLSSHFLPTVLGKIRETPAKEPAAGRYLSLAFLVGLPVVLILIWLGDSSSSRSSYRRYVGYEDYEYFSYRFLLSASTAEAAGVIPTVAIVLVAFLLRRYLRRHAPVPLLQGRASGAIPFLRCVAFLGILFLVADVASIIEPRLLFRSPQFAWWYTLLHQVWMLASLLVIIITLYCILVYHMAALERLAHPEKKEEA